MIKNGVFSGDAKFLSLPRDVFINMFMDNLDLPEDVLSVCNSSKAMSEKCNSNDYELFKKLLWRDFQVLPINNPREDYYLYTSSTPKLFTTIEHGFISRSRIESRNPKTGKLQDSKNQAAIQTGVNEDRFDGNFRFYNGIPHGAHTFKNRDLDIESKVTFFLGYVDSIGDLPAEYIRNENNIIQIWRKHGIIHRDEGPAYIEMIDGREKHLYYTDGYVTDGDFLTETESLLVSAISNGPAMEAFFGFLGGIESRDNTPWLNDIRRRITFKSFQVSSREDKAKFTLHFAISRDLVIKGHFTHSEAYYTPELYKIDDEDMEVLNRGSSTPIAPMYKSEDTIRNFSYYIGANYSSTISNKDVFDYFKDSEKQLRTLMRIFPSMNNVMIVTRPDIVLPTVLAPGKYSKMDYENQYIGHMYFIVHPENSTVYFFGLNIGVHNMARKYFGSGDPNLKPLAFNVIDACMKKFLSMGFYNFFLMNDIMQHIPIYKKYGFQELQTREFIPFDVTSIIHGNKFPIHKFVSPAPNYTALENEENLAQLNWRLLHDFTIPTALMDLL